MAGTAVASLIAAYLCAHMNAHLFGVRGITDIWLRHWPRYATTAPHPICALRPISPAAINATHILGLDWASQASVRSALQLMPHKYFEHHLLSFLGPTPKQNAPMRAPNLPVRAGTGIAV